MPARKTIKHAPVTPTKDERWNANVELSHESFGGYTHKDGTVDITVCAPSRTEAEHEVRKKAKRLYPLYDCRLLRLSHIAPSHETVPTAVR